MLHRHFPVLSVATLLVLSACSTPVATTGNAGQNKPAATQNTLTPPAAAFTGSTISGLVRGPSGIIAAGSLNIIGAGAGNIVAAGSGNIVAAGSHNYRAQATSVGLGQQALANAEVFLADATGAPLPRLAHVKTDVNGSYTIDGVPPGYPVMVVVKIKTKDRKDAVLRTLVKSSALGANADIDVGTTLLATSITAGKDTIGDVNLSTFRSASAKVAASLSDDSLPDLSDAAAINLKVNALATSVAEIGTALTELKADIAQIKADLNDLKTKLDQQSNASAPPANQPATTPSPAGPSTPNPATEATPTPYTPPTAITASTGTSGTPSDVTYASASPSPANATPTPSPATATTYATPTPVASAATTYATPTPSPANTTTSATPTPAAATPTPVPSSAVLSLYGHVTNNPQANPNASLYGITVELRGPNTSYPNWDATPVTDTSGGFSTSLAYTPGQTTDYYVQVKINASEEGIGHLIIAADGTATFNRLYTGQYPTRLITIP